jgi:hypothetical protein
MLTTPDTWQHRFSLIIAGCDVIRKEVTMPGQALTFAGVNCLNLLSPTGGAQNGFLPRRIELPLKAAAFTMDYGHLGQP